jgi:diguanylate cyclase (GGDEF)-like protein
LAVGVALPYATERTLRLLFAMAWLVAVAVAILGQMLPYESNLPYWYRSGFSAASLVTAITVVLLLLWQFRSRLMGTLSQVEATKKQAMYDATHDALTGLPNRVLLVERLTRMLEHPKQDQERDLFAVLYLDLDRFKNVNDSLGHATGDQLLVEVAYRLEACVHPNDVVARLGGDEFVILLDNLKAPKDATQVVERILGMLKAPFGLNNNELYTTASVGVVLVRGSPGVRKPEDLLRDADTAMYWAKEKGKARYAVFDEEMRAHAVQLLRLEMDLRRAVEHDEFVVHYQPIVALGSGRTVAFEALVRWQHPERGLILPAEFVPLAEETELITTITMSVLREACLRTSLWRMRFPDCRPLSVNVNLSLTQLGHPNLVDQVGGILHETRLEGRLLRLEITEGAIMRDAERTIETLSRLRDDLGVRIHIDDFGTGHSSLAHLHQFPVDALKIDQSFVGNIDALEKRGESAQIAQTIATLAHSLGMDVIAEGVHTQEQLKQVRAMGCNYAQGFWFSEPVDAQTAEELVAALSLSKVAQ